MCGRSTRTNPVAIEGFTLTFNPYQLDRSFFRPAFNVAPSQLHLALLRDEQGIAARGMKWGFVPAGVTGTPTSAPINARSESAENWSFFRDAYQNRRCVIVADGFYEWQRNGKGKQPYFVRLKGGRAFGFAGLWERNESVGEGCAILTTLPNAVVAPLHNRMPCILDKDGAQRWLDPTSSRSGLRELLRPFSADQMECWPVSLVVNNPANDDPECIASIDGGHAPAF